MMRLLALILLATLATACGDAVRPGPEADTSTPPPTSDAGPEDVSSDDVTPPECTEDSDCDDSIDCTLDFCTDAGTCAVEANDSLCSDGDVCTGVELCDATAGCRPGEPLVCDDGVACTVDSCDADQGCANTADDSVCDDQDACTGVEICDVSQGCQAGEPLVCDDGVTCTVDNCDATQGCVNAADDSACDDQDVCTGVETCDTAQGCQAGEPLVCDDGVACTVDSCDASQGCANSADDSVCDDQDVCTGAESCDTTLGCQGGEPLSCDDGVACTTDTCDSTDGCANAPDDVVCDDTLDCTADSCDAVEGCTHLAQDTVCDDGDVCTGLETCDVSLGCQAGDALVCDDGVGCTVDSCDLTDGCSNTPDDVACDDALVCTGVESCDATLGCQAGTPPEGCCTSDASCDDGDICNGVESCDMDTRTCLLGELLACDDEVACTVDSCDATDGCVYTPDDTACDDSVGCTVDSCDATDGCLNVADDTACDDEDLCTGAETCDAALDCQPGEPLVCDDADVCTGVESCDAVLGCQGGADLNCDDSVDCTTDTCDATDGCVYTPDDTLNDGEEVSAVDGDDCQTLSDPRLRDTDGDLIPDQIELITGTSPTNASSYDLDQALLELSITPSYISLPFGTFVGDSIRSVELMGVLIDGSGIDLSIHPDIAWYSYNTSVADATVSPGSIIAYGVGETTIEAGVGSHSAEVAVSVFDFTPTFLAKMNVTGDARAVSLGSGMAVVATTAGLSRITINLSLPPVEDSHLTLEGEMKDVKLQGGLAYAAGDAGFVVADVTTLELTQVGSLPLPASYVYDLDVSGGVAVVGTQNALHIIDVSTPTEPVVTATIDVAVTVMGVALDGATGAIALGTSGIASLSIEDPLNPVLGSPTNLSANVLEVDLADGVAIVAMGSAGLATVDMSDPAAPVHLASTNGQGAFSLNDLVIEGTRVFGSDTLAAFPSLPVIGVEVPDDPVFASRTSTRSMGGFSSRSVDAKSGIFAFAGGTVVVGIYDVIKDEEGVAPEVILTNPEEGALFIEGETLPMHAFATDDIMVSAVEFFVDGQSVGIRAESPYTFNLGGLVEGSVLTLHAEATDLGGNVGVSSPISVAVVADPLTTVIGRVLGPDDAPREGVSVSTLDQTITTTTLGDGTFELLGVRTVNDVMVVAEEPLSFTCIAGECGGVFTACQDAAPCEVPFVGIGGPQEPVRGGVTELGDIVIEGTSQPLVMTGVVARPWTFTAFESVGGGAPVSEISGVMARPWTFTSFDSVGVGAPVSEMSGVVARPWTFTSFDSAGGGALVSEMSGVVARPWTFTSFDSAGGEAPVSVMTGVVARPWTFVSEDPP